MNQIPQKQNEEKYLQYLAAQRQLYYEDKRWFGIFLVAAVLVGIAGSGALAFLNDYLAYTALASATVFVAEILIMSLISRRRIDAARIQELMDCELLELPWNDTLGKKPKITTIRQAVERYQKRHKSTSLEELKDWYETVDRNDPLAKARIACQMENLHWNAELIHLYVRYMIFAESSLAVLLVLYSLTANPDIQHFLAGPLLLFLPALGIGLKNAWDHHKAGQRVEELIEISDRLWEEAGNRTSKPAELTQASRTLQTEIFHHRSENPPVFDWIYERAKKGISRTIK